MDREKLKSAFLSLQKEEGRLSEVHWNLEGDRGAVLSAFESEILTLELVKNDAGFSMVCLKAQHELCGVEMSAVFPVESTLEEEVVMCRSSRQVDLFRFTSDADVSAAREEFEVVLSAFRKKPRFVMEGG